MKQRYQKEDDCLAIVVPYTVDKSLTIGDVKKSEMNSVS